MGRKPYVREHGSPRAELIEMRHARFPHVQAQEFALMLGVSRMHLTSIERGRRQPSLDLALRWVALLGEGATVELFGPLPRVAKYARDLKRLGELNPDVFEAA